MADFGWLWVSVVMDKTLKYSVTIFVELETRNVLIAQNNIMKFIERWTSNDDFIISVTAGNREEIEE